MRCLIAFVHIVFLLPLLMPVRAEAVTFQLTAVVTELQYPTNPFDLELGDPMFWVVSYPDAFLSTTGDLYVPREDTTIRVVLGSFSIDFLPYATTLLGLRDGLPFFVQTETTDTTACPFCTEPFIADVFTESGNAFVFYTEGHGPSPDILGRFTDISTVPEPSTWLLIGSGLLGLGLVRRRRSTVFPIFQGRARQGNS